MRQTVGASGKFALARCGAQQDDAFGPQHHVVYSHLALQCDAVDDKDFIHILPPSLRGTNRSSHVVWW